MQIWWVWRGSFYFGGSHVWGGGGELLHDIILYSLGHSWCDFNLPDDGRENAKTDGKCGRETFQYLPDIITVYRLKLGNWRGIGGNWLRTWQFKDKVEEIQSGGERISQQLQTEETVQHVCDGNCDGMLRVRVYVNTNQVPTVGSKGIQTRYVLESDVLITKSPSRHNDGYCTGATWWEIKKGRKNSQER